MALFVALSATSPVNACSFFMIHDGTQVLAGNNEDYWDSDTWVWYVPADKTKHGCVFLGYGNRSPQGGMNDQGLFFDYAATDLNPITGSSQKPTYNGNFIYKVMRECATVEEALAVYDRYNLAFMAKAQVLICDATGDSVIIEGDAVLRKQGNYQITTNFYQSHVKNGRIPCERYKSMDRMLSAENEASVDLVLKTLAAVHQEGPISTQYSNICDLVNLRVYLYHFHNFQEVVTIDLREELAKGKHESRIRDLFNESFAARTYRLKRESKLNSKPPITIIALRSSTITLVIGSLIGVIVAVCVGWLRTGRVWKGIFGGALGALLGGSGTWLAATLIHALTGWPEDSSFLGNKPTLAVVPLLAIVLAVLGAVFGAVFSGRPRAEGDSSG
jgi:hypothetical protein